MMQFKICSLLLQIYVGKKDYLKKLVPAYIAMWTCMFFLQLRIEWQLHTFRDKEGRPNPKEADAIFWGRYLRAFGVEAPVYASPNKFWLVVLLTLIPSVVVLFLTTWISEPTFEYQCAEESVAVPGPFGEKYCPTANICCSVLATQFAPTKFFAYLAGNLLTAYKMIQYAAKERSQRFFNLSE
jgi:hypothetical protein